MNDAARLDMLEALLREGFITPTQWADVLGVRLPTEKLAELEKRAARDRELAEEEEKLRDRLDEIWLERAGK